MSDWTASLRRASFRGVPFGVLTGDSHFGRRAEAHGYPFRDTPWNEDLGRAPRPVNIVGFLITDSAVYGGGDVMAQRDALKAAIETPGGGLLVHPTLGEMTVIGTVAILERWDTGRYFELQFAFAEAGQRLYPSTAADTGGQAASAASAADAAAAFDFAAATTPLPAGALALAAVAGAAQGWTGRIVALTADATSLVGLASRLVGPYGRYSNGANAGLAGAPGAIYAPSTTVADLVAEACAGRAAVAAAAAAETAIAADLGLPGAVAADLAAAAQAITAALAATAADPGDALRLLALLAAFAIGGTSGAAGAIGDLHRRAAVVALARASTAYQPSGYDDAIAVRGQVTAALDVEIGTAGDEGADATFAALRSLRSAVVQDLTARGGALVPMTTVTSQLALPSLVLAQRLYRDATRADELVTEADPIHPLFMPLSFQALAA